MFRFWFQIIPNHLNMLKFVFSKLKTLVICFCCVKRKGKPWECDKLFDYSDPRL